VNHNLHPELLTTIDRLARRMASAIGRTSRAVRTRTTPTCDRVATLAGKRFADVRRAGRAVKRNAWPAAIGTGSALLGIGMIAGLVYLLWWITTSIGHALHNGVTNARNMAIEAGRYAVNWPVTRTITTPVRHYLEQHATGLPASPGLLWAAWLAVTAGLFLLATAGSRGARLGWLAHGALTTAAVWAGSPTNGRDLAAAVTITAWSVLSIAAYRTALPAITTVIDRHRYQADGEG
jgi:hypothetical protein